MESERYLLNYLGLEVSSIRHIQGLDMAYWGFLGVGTTLDIFQNIIFIPYFQYGVLVFWIRRIELYSSMVFGECRHRYAVSSLMDTVYWSSEYGWKSNDKKNTQEAFTTIENKAKVQTCRNKPQVSSSGGTSTQIDAITALTKQVEALKYHIASMRETYDQNQEAPIQLMQMGQLEEDFQERPLDKELELETITEVVEINSSGSTTSHSDLSLAGIFIIKGFNLQQIHIPFHCNDFTTISFVSDSLLPTDPSEIETFLSFPFGNEDKVFDPGILIINEVFSFTRNSPHLLIDNFMIDNCHILSEISLKIVSSISFHPKDKEIRGESS
ncbi:hypothetical protein Tco_0630413 [Tanacetum coccineum]